jgi:hypothetical protein
MPLVRCAGCQGRTPASAVRCVQCGALPPECPDCHGSGRCPDCGADPAAPPADHACAKCAGTARCPGCEGRKRRWAA